MKKFRDLRESAPNIRAPADKDFWNKNVLLAPHAFSEPTKDNNVFKAANVKAFGGKRNIDQTQGEDQSQGYTSVIQFGDYVAHLLKMIEDNEYITDEEIDFLEEIASLSNDEREELFNEEIQLDELSKDTLRSYRDKAVDSQVNALNARDDAKASKRLRGYSKATMRLKGVTPKSLNKLTKEESLDEFLGFGKSNGLSGKSKINYIANKDARNMDHDETEETISRAIRSTALRRAYQDKIGSQDRKDQLEIAKRMARNEEFINESDLSTDAHELVLHADNTQHLYNQRKAFVDNVARHKKRGNYDEEKGRKLWGYYADRVAQDYHKTYGDKTSKWHHMFPTSTRKEVAAHYEQRFRHGSMDESYVSRNSFAREELHEETANKQTTFQRIKNKLKNRYKKVGKTVKDYKDDLKFGWEFGEETDINELSKGTLSRYIEGSSIDAVKKTQFADLNQRMAQSPSFGDREDRERAVRISDNENKKVAKRLRGVRLAARKMAEEKLTHKKWEGSTADNIVDRVAGYKEGGKKGEALDDRLVKAINKLTKEETIDELNKGTLGRYVRRATKDVLDKKDFSHRNKVEADSNERENNVIL